MTYIRDKISGFSHPRLVPVSQLIGGRSSGKDVLTNNFNGGTDAVAITPANSGGTSGDPFDNVIVQSGATATYDNDHVHTSPLAAKLACPTAGDQAWMEWGDSLADADIGYLRFYLYLEAALPSGTALAVAKNQSPAGNAALLIVDGTRHLIAQDFESNDIGTMTSQIALNQWVRIEMKVKKGTAANGLVEVKLFNNADSVTPTETLTIDPAPVDVFNIGRWEVGVMGASGTAWFDNLGSSITDYLGPVPTEYQDSGTVLFKLTPSAVENAQFVDADTIRLSFTPSSVDVAQFADADTARVTLTPSATDIAQLVDADTARLSLTPSGTDVAIFVDAVTVPLALTPSGSDTYTPGAGGTEYIDSGTVTLALTPSGTDIQAKEYVDANTARLSLTPSGTDTAQFVDSNTVRLSFTPSGTELLAHDYTDTGTATIKFTPSAIIEHYGKPSPPGSVRGLMALFVSVEAPTYVDTGTARLSLTPSSVDIAQYVDSNTARVGLTPSGTDAATFIDAATVGLLLTPSGTDTLQVVDSTTAVVVLIPSGDEFIGGQTQDAGTVILRLTPSVVTEIRYIFDVLLAGTLSRRWAATDPVRRWGTGALAGVNRWSGIMLNRKWSGTVGSRKWSGNMLKRWSATYLGRGKD